MIKLLFILFSLFANLFLLLLPIYGFYLIQKNWNNNSFIELLSAHKKLIVITYSTWFILFLFDPTQKTVKQIIFPDPVILGVGLCGLILVKSTKNLPNPVYPVLSIFGAVITWFGIPPLEQL